MNQVFRMKFLCSFLLIVCVSASNVFRIIGDEDSQQLEHEYKLRPIVLIPGICGNQLFAKLNRSETPHYYCSKKTKSYYRLWFDVKGILPLGIDCFLDDIKLIYNNVSRTTSDQNGVDVKVPGSFGDTSPMEYLGPLIGYFARLVHFAQNLGYKRGSTLMGAAFDWRRAPNEQMDYFDNLKTLLEKSYVQNGKSAAICCHSMGCLYALYFLNQQSQSWKNKYVSSFITVGGPWGGAVAAVEAFTVGYNLHIKVLPGYRFMEAQRTFPTTAFLMPKEEVFKDQVFIETRRKNYTVHDYKQLFDEYGQPLFYEMWKDSHWMGSDLQHPGVDVLCIYGINIPTVEKLVFTATDGANTNSNFVYGNGDGTVNLPSLEACRRWESSKKHTFQYAVFRERHLQMIFNKKVIDKIFDYLGE